jgi:hypothetical protein
MGWMLYFYRNKTVFISSGGDYDLKSCNCGGKFKNHDFRRSQRFPLDGTSIWKLKISCHFLQFAKTENIWLKSALKVEGSILLTSGETLYVEGLYAFADFRKEWQLQEKGDKVKDHPQEALTQLSPAYKVGRLWRIAKKDTVRLNG